MKVIISTESSVLQERLSTILSEFSDVELIDKTKNLDEAESLISVNEADVLVTAFHNIQKNVFKKLNGIKQVHKDLVVIVLTNNSTDQYITLWKNSGADYVLDPASQFNEIVEVLSALIYKNVSETLKLKKAEKTNQD